MKLAPSNRTLALLFIGILIFSIVSAILFVYQTSTMQTQFNQNLNSLNQTQTQNYNTLNQTYHDLLARYNTDINNLSARLPVDQYDYVIYRNWNYLENVSVYFAKNGKTGLDQFNGTDAATILNQALANGNSIYIKADEYNLTTNINLTNKKNARIDSDAATLNLYSHQILIRGDTYEQSQNNQISGLKIVDGTIRIENSFKTTLTNMIFENCTSAIEVANTNTWTEATKLDTIHFNKCSQSIVFKTNTTGATGSYGNTLITRCYFNLIDNSTAITVEPYAELTDSQLSNIRIWAGESGTYNQTGLQVNGSMHSSLLDGVVFESFADSTQNNLENSMLYAITLDTPFEPPVLQVGLSIIGGWTSRIHNPGPTPSWIYGEGAIFKRENIPIAVGKFNYGETEDITTRPLTISYFKPRITVQGSFLSNETVTVRIRLNLIDNTLSDSVEKTFTTNQAVWLSDDDLLHMFPSQDMIWSILIDAKVSTANSEATVTVDLYGTTT